MKTLAEQIQEAEDALIQLKRKQQSEPCSKVGCDMQFFGGANAGCELGNACSCSVSVHVCTKCGDSDYGDNPEANEIRSECRKRIEYQEHQEQIIREQRALERADEVVSE